MTVRMQIALVLSASLALAGAAHAGTDEAHACAAKLGKDSRMIYERAAPQVTPSSDLRALVTDTTKMLVFKGMLNRSIAQPAALAAGECLRMLKT